MTLAALHRRYLKHHRRADRDALIKAHYGFLTKIATRHAAPYFTVNEAMSAGVLGLLEALKRYKPEAGAFTTFSYWWIIKFILLERSNAKNIVPIPVAMVRKNRRIRKLQRQGLDDQEVCETLQINEAELAELEQLHEFPNGVGLDAPDSESGDNQRLSELDGCDGSLDPCQTLMDKENGTSRSLEGLQEALGQLSLRERKIVMGRYESPPIKFSELARELGISRQGVRNLYLTAMEKLKDMVPAPQR